MQLATSGITTLEQDRIALARNAVLGLAVAGCLFAVSYANGGFDTTTKAYAGISAWWLLGTGAAIGIAAARTRVDRLSLAALGLLAAFALWTLLSMSWASDGGRAFAQFDQVSFYVAVLALAIVVARLVPASTIVSGVALAISAIGCVALVSRFFPSTFGVEPSTILPPITSRLSFPVGYWNGLGIEMALAYPLLFSIMTSRRSRFASALAALPLPILGAVMYLTSSRGAFVAAVVAVVVYLLLAPNRWTALVATTLAAAVGAVSVASLAHRNELLSGVMTDPVAVDQGHRAALVIGIACVVTALVWLGLAEAGRRVSTPPKRVGWAVAGVIVLGVVLAIALSHPIAKFNSFRSNSFASGSSDTSFVNSHLLSSSGSGRWQFWGAAISEFEAHPLNGGGAGSWGAWWLEHGSLPGFFTQYAHSLYLEALAELGIVGLLLIGGFVVVAVVGAVRSALALGSSEIAAAAACGVAFFAAAAYDWVWQLSGIALVGVGMLGVALGALPSTRGAWGRAAALRPAVAVVAVAAIIPQFVVLAAGTHLANSHAAFNRGDATGARSQALAAKAIEPWAASPYLQLGQIAEAQHDYLEASQWLDKAISRSRRDWQLWLIAAGIETRLATHSSGAQARKAIARAQRYADEARRLNPGSPYFTNPS